LSSRHDIDSLIDRFKKHDKIALARLITLIENQPELAPEIFKHFENNTNEAHIIGITGSPGVGKSTLTNAICKKLLEENKKIGVISVDPTSPFSGGAFLGDRVRMTDVSLHPNVFIRSLASRGYHGGLSRAVFDISMLYEAYGMDIIIIETVGVGQAELDIYNLAYTIIVVLVPGYGDVIQMQKAGIIEIGDIYDVNKKDLGGEDIAVQIEIMLDDSTTFQGGWRPPVSMTNSITGEGVMELVQNIWDHEEHLRLSELINEKKKNRYSYKIRQLLSSKIEQILMEKVLSKEEISQLAMKTLENGKFKLYDEVQKVFEDALKKILK